MVLSINQETFDEVVQENIDEFAMTREEAIEDAVKQFETQGVDLSHIIKNLMLTSLEDTDKLSTIIKELGDLLKTKNATNDLLHEKLSVIKVECDRGLEYRVYAGKQGCYNIILDIMAEYDSNVDIIKDSLKVLISLMTKQPDLLDVKGIELLIKYLDRQEPEIQKLTLKWAKECCVMHELNRQRIFDASILTQLKVILQEGSSSIIFELLGVVRALVLDDDVRVEFGRAHEHARAIANDTLCLITGLLNKFQNDETLASEIMLTISSLLVRNEFCKKVEQAGALNTIKSAMITFYEKDKIIRQCFKLLKALCGNDEVKASIIQIGLTPVMASTLSGHKDSLETVKNGLACIAALTLRSPENSKVIFEAGTAEVIVDCMKNHSNDVNVQKFGSWAVRNMVSRSRYQNEKFISLGIEDILKNDLSKFSNIEYDIKSALRDLGCNVKLKEEWTGKGGMLTTQLNQNLE